MAGCFLCLPNQQVNIPPRLWQQESWGLQRINSIHDFLPIFFSAYILLASSVASCHNSFPPPFISYSSLSICFCNGPHFQLAASVSQSPTCIQPLAACYTCFFVYLLLEFVIGFPRLPPAGCLVPLLHSCRWSIFFVFVIPNFRSGIYCEETSVTSCYLQVKMS